MAKGAILKAEIKQDGVVGLNAEIAFKFNLSHGVAT